MKKFLLMTALVAGFLTSCSEDEYGMRSVTDSNTIAFATKQASTPKAMTRSGESITSINKFAVTAVNADNTVFFSNETFTYNGGTGTFQSQTPHYWPTTGTLSFYAISDIGSYALDANKVPTYKYSNWAAEKDLVAATVKAGEKEIPYPLTFRHLTSQIYVSAQAENQTEALTYNLVAVNLTAPSTGTYSFDANSGGVGTWVIDNTKTSEYSYKNALPREFKQNGQIELSSCYWNILPVTSGKLYFKIEYQVLQNGKVIADYTGTNNKECTVDAPGLVAGMRYRYNFILTRGTDEEITFTTTFTDWEDGSSTNYTPTEKVIESITLNADQSDIILGNSKKIEVKSILPSDAPNKSVIWSSSDESVATVDQEGNITSVGLGNTIIKATARDGGGAFGSCDVIVYNPDANGHAYVDLDLPSGTLWATMNIGASSPEGYGDFYMWGDVTSRSRVSSDIYSDMGGYSRTETVIAPEHDIVTITYGGDWKIPTIKQMTELDNYTTYVEQVINGHTCVVLTSKINGKTVIIPKAGKLWDGDTDHAEGRDYVDNMCRYWSSTAQSTYKAYTHDYGMYGFGTLGTSKWGAFPIRGIISANR